MNEDEFWGRAPVKEVKKKCNCPENEPCKGSSD